MNNTNVIIVAGGLGTRFKDLSCFPKILLPTNISNSIIEEDIKWFKNDNLYLIINEKYYNMVVNYLKVNNLYDKIKLIASTKNTNGSYNSILEAMENYDLPRQNVLFVWSDLILRDDLSGFNSDKNIIFTYSKEHYRYKYENNKIFLTSDYSGNVPGVYYIKDFNKIAKYKLDEKTNFDLIEAVKDIDSESRELSELIEYRDYDTYVNIIKNSNPYVATFKTRFFNSLTVDGDVLTKQAIDPNYYSIIKREYNWYKFGQRNVKDFDKITPSTFGYSDIENSFKMEYLKDYIQFHKFLKSAKLEDIKKVYDNIQVALDTIHQAKINDLPRFAFGLDLKREVVTKVIERCDKIKHMLIKYNEEERNHMINLLNKAYEYLVNFEKLSGKKTTYSFCHGDLNGSNIMVNPDTLEIKFIDPRGYFGQSIIYGWEPYEYSKLLYCLYGYDDFNILPQIYGLDEPIILTNIIDEIEYLNKKEYRILVGVIYVALAGYISQDIMKANIAYEYGIKLLEKELEYE